MDIIGKPRLCNINVKPMSHFDAVQLIASSFFIYSENHFSVYILRQPQRNTPLRFEYAAQQAAPMIGYECIVVFILSICLYNSSLPNHQDSRHHNGFRQAYHRPVTWISKILHLIFIGMR